MFEVMRSSGTEIVMNKRSETISVPRNLCEK